MNFKTVSKTIGSANRKTDHIPLDFQFPVTDSDQQLEPYPSPGVEYVRK